MDGMGYSKDLRTYGMAYSKIRPKSVRFTFPHQPQNLIHSFSHPLDHARLGAKLRGREYYVRGAGICMITTCCLYNYVGCTRAS